MDGFTAIVTGALYIIIGLVAFSVVGSAIVRLGSVVGEKIRSASEKADPSDVIPEPDFFHGFRVSFCINTLIVILGAIVYYVSPSIITHIEVELSVMHWMFGTIAAVGSFILASGIIALMLPTTYGRGSIVNAIYYVIMSCIVALIIVVSMYAFAS